LIQEGPAVRQFTNGKIDGVEVRKLSKHVDERGWLCELFRADEVTEPLFPAMGYASLTRVGITRGPHEHSDQADWLCFVGSSNFLVVLWDNRPESPTYNHRMRMVFGEDAPGSLIVPAGVVHGYRNVGCLDALVINLPNRLFMGPGRAQAVDEIRHETDPASPFRMDG
jgi:dTDP-4-dehydrorhamnose 3,5-epimerase